MLTTRDKQILEILSCRLKVLTLGQIAAVWWRGSTWPDRNAKRRLAQLENRDLIATTTLMVRPVPELNGPVIRWNQGDESPEFGPISYLINQRWRDAPEPTRVYLATERCARMFGGHPAKLRVDERAHDLVLAATFLAKFKAYYLKQEGMPPNNWLSEALIRRSRTSQSETLPDAFLEPNTAIEVGGRYSKAKLEQFHRYCQSNKLNYEIW